jgi:hypothetical protein
VATSLCGSRFVFPAPRRCGEGAQLGSTTGLDYANPRHDERPCRSSEERGRALDRSAIEDADTRVAWQTEGSVPSRDGPRLLRILGDVDEDGTGTPASRKVERFLDDIGNLLGALHEIVVFRDRHRDAFNAKLPATRTARSMSIVEYVRTNGTKRKPAPREVRGAGSRGVG